MCFSFREVLPAIASDALPCERGFAAAWSGSTNFSIRLCSYLQQSTIHHDHLHVSKIFFDSHFSRQGIPNIIKEKNKNSRIRRVLCGVCTEVTADGVGPLQFGARAEEAAEYVENANPENETK